MLPLPHFDSDVIEWNCTREQVECHIIGHSGTRVRGTFAKHEACVSNSVNTHTCAFENF